MENAPNVLAAGGADGKEQYQNNFPICAALSIATTGRAGGYVRDGKSGFGKVIRDPFLSSPCGIKMLPRFSPATLHIGF